MGEVESARVRRSKLTSFTRFTRFGPAISQREGEKEEEGEDEAVERGACECGVE